MTYWPQSTSEEILYTHERNFKQLTVVPVPSTATVTLTATGYTQKSGKNVIKVPAGTVVHYKLTAATYNDVEGNITVNETQVVTIDMNEYQYDTFTIVPTPSDATVTLTASGATQSGNSITVKRGTTINYVVERTGYDTVTGIKVTTQPSESLAVTMQVKTYAFTITPNPSDATVTLVSSGGQTQSGNTIRVNYNNTVTWTVSKTGYTTRTSMVTVTEDQTLGVDLTLEDYIVTVVPTPSNATVVLTSSGGQSQSGNTITVNYNDVVSYTVSATNYQTKTGSVTITAAQTLNISLTLVNRTLTISPTPSTATVVLTAAGYTQSGNSITVPHGTSVSYSVSKSLYTTASGTKVVNATETMAVTLTELPTYTVTFQAIDEESQEAISGATYTLTSVEGNSSTNSITVHQGTVINYNIEAEQHATTSGTYTAVATATVNIEMPGEVTYYAWTSGTNTVYTQSETPNETYGEYIFSAPNELGNAITAHTSNSVTAGGIIYTRNSASDNYTKVNSFYYTIDTTKYSSSYTTGYAPFTTGTYTSLVGKTITIDWGDNSTTMITDGVISSSTNKHTYASAGEYNIRITSTGDFPAVNFYYGFGPAFIGLVTKVKSVIPKCKVTDGRDLYGFSLCFSHVFSQSGSTLTSIPQDLFKYNTAVTNFGSCFYGCTGLTSIPTGLFDNNTAVTNFGSCFYDCSVLTSIPADLFKYNTAVTNFKSCFSSCSVLTSIPTGLFDNNTAVTNFSYCFNSCSGLTSIPANLFDNNTAVTDFSGCFNSCTGLTSIPADLFKYNTAVTNFKSCFSSCSVLTSIPANLFDNNTAVTNFSYCFYGCTGLTSIPANLFDNNTAVTNFGSCFYDCSVLTSIPTGLFDNNTAVTNFSYCFGECSGLTSIPSGLFNNNTVVTDFSYCFQSWLGLTSIPTGLFDNNTAVTNFSGCFNSCRALTSIPAGLFDNNTAVTNFGSCFYDCSVLTSIPTGLFDNNTAVTNFSYCFNRCTGLTSIPADLFRYNTAVTDFSYCFYNCSGLTSIPADLFRYNTAVTNFRSCFHNCSKLQLNANIFCDESTEMTTRFANVTPVFNNCFRISSFSGTQGTAPQLWSYTYSGTPTSTYCFYGHSATSLTNYSSIPSAWGRPA